MKRFKAVTALSLALYTAPVRGQSVPSGSAVLLRSLQATGADSVLPRHASLRMSGTFVAPGSDFGGTTSSVRTSTGEFHWVMDVAGYGRIENGYAGGTG